MNQKDIIRTIEMIESQHLDIRTITMGISLMDCISDDAKKTADRVKTKIAKNFPALANRFCNGVSLVSSERIIVAIFPTSVCIPVAVTIALP